MTGLSVQETLVSIKPGNVIRVKSVVSNCASMGHILPKGTHLCMFESVRSVLILDNTIVVEQSKNIDKSEQVSSSVSDGEAEKVETTVSNCRLKVAFATFNFFKHEFLPLNVNFYIENRSKILFLQ